MTEVIESLDDKLLARRLVETIVNAHRAQGAALYLKEELGSIADKGMTLAYATPDWIWEEGEVSIILRDENRTLGRLLLGRSRDREDYTFEECDAIRSASLPVVHNIYKVRAMHGVRALHQPTEYQRQALARGQ